MKLADKKLNIFTELKKVNPDLKLFTLVPDATILDTYYNSTQSERFLSDLAIGTDINTIANMVNSIYGGKWDDLITQKTNGAELLASFGELEKTDTTREGNNENTGTTTNTVSAFNEDDFTNDNKSENSNTGKSNETVSVKRNKGNIQNYGRVWNYLLNQNILYVIINDVNKLLVLSIY